MDFILNAAIFLVTAAIVFRCIRKNGAWTPKEFRSAFRFFTLQSNALCGVSALCMCLFPNALWAWILKYIGTAAVTVTLLTVFIFLGPTMEGGLKPLLAGSSLFLHLLTPLAALFSFLVFERRGMGFPTALLGMLPVALYGVLYLYKVVLAPEDRRWEDFYGFNRGGHWPVSFAAMFLGAFLVCMALMLLQNL